MEPSKINFLKTPGSTRMLKTPWFMIQAAVLVAPFFIIPVIFFSGMHLFPDFVTRFYLDMIGGLFSALAGLVGVIYFFMILRAKISGSDTSRLYRNIRDAYRMIYIQGFAIVIFFGVFAVTSYYLMLTIVKQRDFIIYLFSFIIALRETFEFTARKSAIAGLYDDTKGSPKAIEGIDDSEANFFRKRSKAYYYFMMMALHAASLLLLVSVTLAGFFLYDKAIRQIHPFFNNSDMVVAVISLILLVYLALDHFATRFVRRKKLVFWKSTYK